MAKPNKKVLIVDDDKNFVFVVKQNFEGTEFSIITAKDGQEGLEIALKEKPDLILLDILMPKMNGIEMAKKLQESGADMPIIFLTNAQGLDYISQSLEAGGGRSDYVLKTDVSMEDIIKKVRQKING